MTMPSLLPPNATPIENAYVVSGGRILDADPPVDMVWDAWRCPSKYLPYLAWALSVDQWDDSWSEIARRQAIADSPAWHRIKGSRVAVEQVIARATDAPVTLAEWWESEPKGRRGTSMLHLEIDDPVAAEAARRRVIPLVMGAKPKSRPIVVIAGEVVPGSVRFGGVIHTTSLTIVNPPDYAGETATGAITIGGIIITAETITVETAA